MNINRIFLLVVFLLGLLVHSLQDEKKEAITMEQCKTQELSLRGYFRTKISLIYQASKEDLFRASSMISPTVLYELETYSNIFEECSLIESKNIDRYRRIRTALYSLTSDMRNIKGLEGIKPEAQEALFVWMRERYDKIILELELPS
jgi:hypothetical protein